MINGDKVKLSQLPADNSSSDFSSGGEFILLIVTDGWLYDVLFDARHIEDPLDDYYGVTFLLFEVLLMHIPCGCVIINTFLLVFCGLDANKYINVFDETNRQKYLNKNNINGGGGYIVYISI